MRRLQLRTVALAASILSSGWALPAFAQSAVAASDASDEIVVVARRREERLVDVPIAITALNTADIARLGANDLSGLQGAVPNVNLVQGRGSASNANFFIRGIGQPDALQTFDPAVGVYVDGVYLSRIQGALLSLADVQRVEVLRGPQGTLYGKNTIGGAINIVSRRPDLSATHLEGSLTYGSYEQITGNGYGSAPLVDGKLALSVAGQYDKREGLVTDPRTGRRYNDRNNFTARAILLAKPSDQLELILAGDFTRQHSAPTLGYATAPIIATSFTQGAVVLAPANPYGDYSYRASTSFKGSEGQRLTHWGASLTANYSLSDAVTLSSITAYRDLRPYFFVDIDATQFQVGDVYVGVEQHQFSQELQLKYNSPRLRGVFGLYYLNEKIISHQEAYANDLFQLTTTVPISFLRLIDDVQTTKSYAAFGQATFDFTPQLSLTAGLRYTREEKTYNRVTVTGSSLAALNNLRFAFPNDLPAPLNADNRATFDAWTPMATLSYKPTRDTLIYASAGRGFKSGGFNGRANSTSDLTLIVGGVPTLVTRFKPETVWTYEAGAKGNFLGGRVRLSGDAFYSDYRDFQARVGGGTVGATGVFPVLNAGKLRIFGFELEAAVKPSNALTITSSVGYLDAKYNEFNDGRRVPPTAFSCNPTGNAIVCKPAFAPPLTLRFGADWAIPLGGATLTLGGEGRFVDKQFLSVDNRAGLTENGYWLANAYAQVDFGRYYLRGAVKNAFEELYKTDGQEFSSVGNIQTVYYGDPRTWTITAGFKF